MPNNVTVYVMTVWQNLPSKNTALEATNLNHLEQGIKNVTDFVNTINATSGLYLSQTPFTTALKNKLDGIEAQANKYVLPTASNSTLGGVKVDAETITIDQNGVIHAEAAATQLSALTDVNLEDLADGQILKYDATTGKWVNTSEAEVRTQLSLLEDVDIDDETLADGDALRYNGTTEKWENGPAGDVLDYDETLEVLGDPAEEFEAQHYHKTIVWDGNGSTAPKGQDVNYLEDITKYDQLLIVSGSPIDVQNNAYVYQYLDIDLLINYGAYNWSGFLRRYYTLSSTATTFNIIVSGAEGEAAGYVPEIYRIYGIKY